MDEESTLNEFKTWIDERHPSQPEYLQATKEIAKDVIPIFCNNESYRRLNVFKRLCEPERIIHFSVHWLNDANEVEIHNGWRIQHSGLIGPYKGGLRFHPSVNESVLKFLAFEQSFKNALTGIPIGGAKGGSDFNPKGRSETEVMRFCQAFMGELQRHIGPHTDVPAGDINVGSREIGFLYGEYRKIHNRFGGSLTGKDISFGGSHVRTEATGFGLIYMLRAVLKQHKDEIKNKRIGISGAGNVALHAALKSVQVGGQVISLSNSRDCLIKEEGFSESAISWAIKNKAESDNILIDLCEHHGGDWHKDATPWQQPMDIALPCATQNELDKDAAAALLSNGCKYILEGANMPCTNEALDLIEEKGIPFVPGKASNAGGVAISGLEMSQNATFKRATYKKIDDALQDIMLNIHQQCVEAGTADGRVNYAKGANIAAFRRLADAMVAQGV
ncbi:NADP-specific glutamate dehydrogenase [Alteromonas pelagimontana]|uniref:Glutamate dehydrogenase n=1 Tax=Alteromonas pelagimontana TaxID=1858656 RepID=A0A6M4MHI4_9ALTE|nr:NADP-specific glutamate dehydrogenase [Alteromonas pelagimontana]QJR82482.1 NADP-specific glutamate dehydrogenase [Alteromonas pelagimontana]